MNSKHVDFRIRSLVDHLTRSERKIAQFILEQPEETTKMTASELSKATGTSPASVIRFCKSIGIPSFTELKLELSAERNLPVGQDFSDIDANATVADLKNKLLANANQALIETIQIIDDKSVKEAAKVVADASSVYIFGIGSSHLVAENVAQKFNRIGKFCLCVTDVHQLIGILASAPKESVFIGVSNSGETPEVLSLNAVANDRGLKTISMTQFGTNSLKKKSTIQLSTVRSKEVANRSAATSSLMAQFMLVDLLFYTYILEDYEHHMAHISHSRAAVDDYKQSK